jgi:hypothetical protein
MEEPVSPASPGAETTVVMSLPWDVVEYGRGVGCVWEELGCEVERGWKVGNWEGWGSL